MQEYYTKCSTKIEGTFYWAATDLFLSKLFLEHFYTQMVGVLV